MASASAVDEPLITSWGRVVEAYSFLDRRLGARIGSGDPDSDDFDQRTLIAAKGPVIEIRVPWALLGFSDPSSLTLYDEQASGPTATLKAGRVGIAVAGAGEPLLRTGGYAWEPWQRVGWAERRKAGFDELDTPCASCQRRRGADSGQSETARPARKPSERAIRCGRFSRRAPLRPPTKSAGGHAAASTPASTKTRCAAPTPVPCSTSWPSWCSAISSPDRAVRMSKAPK